MNKPTNKEIEKLEEWIDYEKEHRIETVFDDKPLLYKICEKLLKAYQHQEEQLNNINKADRWRAQQR